MIKYQNQELEIFPHDSNFQSELVSNISDEALTTTIETGAGLFETILTGLGERRERKLTEKERKEQEKLLLQQQKLLLQQQMLNKNRPPSGSNTGMIVAVAISGILILGIGGFFLYKKMAVKPVTVNPAS